MSNHTQTPTSDTANKMLVGDCELETKQTIKTAAIILTKEKCMGYNLKNSGC